MVHTTHDYGIPEGTIVVGVDGSPCSEAALDEAVQIAVAEHRPLTILHAVEGSSLTQTVLTDARDRVALRAPGLEVQLVPRVQDPRDLLVAASEHAALLVVGSRGRGPVRSRLLGSVSLSVSRRAACPVIVVRPHHPGLVRRGVLVGADGSPASTPTLAFAFRQASVRGLPLTVLHVVEHSLDDPEEHRLLVSEAMAGLRERYPDVPTRVEVVVGRRPDAALLAVADQMDLTVVGTHHGGMTHRSVVAAVVERARCPVAVVPLDTHADLAHG